MEISAISVRRTKIRMHLVVAVISRSLREKQARAHGHVEYLKNRNRENLAMNPGASRQMS